MATPKKQVAYTLLNILDNPVMKLIQDNSSDIKTIIEKVREFWKLDLSTRNPTPAEYDDDGNLIKTSGLDLCSFLYALLGRSAIIRLPKYESWRPRSISEDVDVVSKTDRHGVIIGLTSNKNLFSFGVKIVDQNVVGENRVGFPRIFSMTDAYGNLYSGWNKIYFEPTRFENKFLTENKLWDMSTIVFDKFVLPEKWISFYGQYYFITKCLIDRLTDEQTHLKQQKTILDSMPFDKGMTTDIINEWDISSTKEEGISTKFNKFEVEVDVPERDNNFKTYEANIESYKELCNRIKCIRSSLEEFRFITRCIEYVVYNKDYMNTFPSWIKNVSWERDYKTGAKSRTLWNRLKIVQPGPFEKSIAIRTRKCVVSEIVSKEYFEKMKIEGLII